jgi:hypothetical protein
MSFMEFPGIARLCLTAARADYRQFAQELSRFISVSPLILWAEACKSGMMGLRSTRWAVLRVCTAIAAAAAFWLAPGPALAQSCADFAAARSQVYSIYIGKVADDLRAIPVDGDHNAAIRDLNRQYVQKGSSGNSVYLQKLIGLGIFLTTGSDADPADATFKLACEIAEQGPLVLEPLACATIALDGARRYLPGSKALAQRMLRLARDKIASDSEGANARRFVDEIAPVLQACASE